MSTLDGMRPLPWVYYATTGDGTVSAGAAAAGTSTMRPRTMVLEGKLCASCQELFGCVTAAGGVEAYRGSINEHSKHAYLLQSEDARKFLQARYDNWKILHARQR